VVSVQSWTLPLHVSVSASLVALSTPPHQPWILIRLIRAVEGTKRVACMNTTAEAFRALWLPSWLTSDDDTSKGGGEAAESCTAELKTPHG
jgi:hypothetical protein